MTHPVRRRKKHHDEEHENHERWLVSYADMVTLLMCLFIVLFAISQVDKNKYAALSSGLAEGFGKPMSVLDHGVSSTDPALDFVQPLPVNLQRDANPSGAQPPSEKQLSVEALAEATRRAQVQAEARATYADLSRVRERLDAALRKAGHPGAARYQITERGLVVTIVADQVLFDSARADLRPEGRTMLAAVAPVLRSQSHPLAIEGHTNHLPLRAGSGWPSDWELSATRATTVLRYLADVGRVREPTMYAAGFSDTRPLVDPSKPAAVWVNRRVDIVVLSTASSESNALLPSLDGPHRRPSH